MNMSGRLSKNIGFSLLPFAFIFLFEPGFSIIDIFPDFVGYVILCLSLRNLADINNRISDALSGFRKGALISLLRYCSIYFLKSFFIETELSIGLLLFCFVFSFFELAVLIPAYRSLFEGLLSLGIMHDGNAVYQKKTRKVKRLTDGGAEYETTSESKKNVTEKAYGLTVLFIAMRAILMTLPEFTSLTNNTEYEFVALLRIFAFAIMIPISVTWLIKMIAYFVKIKKDRVFVSNLTDLYFKNSKEHPYLYIARSASTGVCTLLVACIFCINIFSDYVDLVPSYLFYAIALIASVFLWKFSKKCAVLGSFSAIGITFSIITQGLTKSFHSEYYPAAIKKSLEAYNAYYKMFAFNIVDSIISFIISILVIFVLWDVYKAHTEIAIAETPKEKRYFKLRFCKGAFVSLLLSAVSMASNIYYVFAQPFYQTQYWYFYYSSIISIAINVSFVFSICFFIGYINNSIKYRYRLDLI